MGWLRTRSAGRSVEAGVAEGEDAAVGGDHPVPTAVGGDGHAHDGLVQGEGAEVPEVGQIGVVVVGVEAARPVVGVVAGPGVVVDHVVGERPGVEDLGAVGQGALGQVLHGGVSDGAGVGVDELVHVHDLGHGGGATGTEPGDADVRLLDLVVLGLDRAEERGEQRLLGSALPPLIVEADGQGGGIPGRRRVRDHRVVGIVDGVPVGVEPELLHVPPVVRLGRVGGGRQVRGGGERGVRDGHPGRRQPEGGAEGEGLRGHRVRGVGPRGERARGEPHRRGDDRPGPGRAGRSRPPTTATTASASTGSTTRRRLPTMPNSNFRIRSALGTPGQAPAPTEGPPPPKVRGRRKRSRLWG